MEERACQLALYLIENRATVRAAAGKFGVSKSTVHKDLSERLPAYNRALYLQVKEVLEENKAQRHIRGGLAILCGRARRSCRKNVASLQKARGDQAARGPTRLYS